MSGEVVLLDATRRGGREAAGEVNGAEVLRDVHQALGRYVIFPSSEAHDAVTLFIAATHAQPAWEHATRLVIKSPLKRCGKTRLQECIALLAYRVLKTVNISVAALVRSIDEADPPTLILDEADTVFGGKPKDRPEGAEHLRGILNSGHSRGWPYTRWDATSRKLEQCPTFAMAVLGGIGGMPDTIEDRAVVVCMRRRALGETVRPYRARRARPQLEALRDRMHTWIRPHLAALADAEPELPVEDREADVWEPLMAVADLAGGDWPDRARKACCAMTGADPGDESTAGERLLADLCNIWGDADNLFTATILERLHGIEEAPWSDWYGHPLSPRDLSRLLKPYGVSSKNVRTGDVQAKGYIRAELTDAWRRYVPHASQPSQPSHEAKSTRQPRDGGETDERPVSVPLWDDKPWDGSGTDIEEHLRTRPDQQEQPAWTGGTDGTAARPDPATFYSDPDRWSSGVPIGDPPSEHEEDYAS